MPIELLDLFWVHGPMCLYWTDAHEAGPAPEFFPDWLE